MPPTTVRRQWRLIELAVFALAVTVVVVAQSPASSQPQSGNEQQVRAAQQQMLRAALNGNKDELSRFLADDLSWTDVNGRVSDKQSLLDRPKPPVRSVEPDHVRVVGTTAVVTATTHRTDGSDVRTLQEWVNVNGQWKLMAHQGTLVAPAGASAAASGGAAAKPAGTSGSVPTTVAPKVSTADERDVWQAQMDILDAWAKGDVSRYSQLTADDFMRIENDGKFFTKRQWLDNVGKNTAQPLKPGAATDAQVRVNNDVATVTLRVDSFNKEGATEPPERQTRIFVKRNGQWQQLAALSTPITE
ncbi:MAG: DUF4440 domain-containing protein [Bacteroidales bacterium]